MNNDTLGTLTHEFHGQRVRTITKDGAPWFVLADVCNVLGLTSPTHVARRLDGDDLNLAQVTDALGREQQTNVINESGLYDVIIRSDAPLAKPFRRWITAEVLPAIHKHGGYLTPEAAEKAITDPDFIIRLANELKSERAKREALETPAANWNTLAATDGTYSISDAGRILQNDGGDTSPMRIYQQLQELGWIGHPHQCKGWRPLQKAIANGWAREVAGAVYRYPNGNTTQAEPKAVLTTDGLAKLRETLPKKTTHLKVKETV